MTKYYIDENGTYKGGFEGDHGIDVSSWTEISAPPPIHASQTTSDDGDTWSVYPPI